MSDDAAKTYIQGWLLVKDKANEKKVLILRLKLREKERESSNLVRVHFTVNKFYILPYPDISSFLVYWSSDSGESEAIIISEENDAIIFLVFNVLSYILSCYMTYLTVVEIRACNFLSNFHSTSDGTFTQ